MFETEYDNEEAIPAEVRHLFKPGEGERFVLIPPGEIKTIADTKALQEALAKERTAHKATKAERDAFEGVDAAELREKLDRLETLEAEAAAGGGDDSEARAEAKAKAAEAAQLRTQLAALEREKTKLSDEAAATAQSLAALETRDRSRRMRDYAREQAREAKLNGTGEASLLAIAPMFLEETEDGRFVTKDGAEVSGRRLTPGVDLDVALAELQPVVPGWWPESTPAGARGGDGAGAGPNPFRADSWSLQRQGEIVREQGVEKAEQLAKSAGTTVGGPRPTRAA